MSSGSGTGTIATTTPAPSNPAQVYCTLAEVIADLELPGVRDEAKVVGYIQAASLVINKRGQFIPIADVRTFYGSGAPYLFVDPLLAVNLLVADLVTLVSADYVLRPRNRHWLNGPYTSIALALGNNWTTEDVIVTGRWGLYEATHSIGATVASQSSTSTTLTVNDASQVSPGLVMLIESEQEYVEATGTATDSTTTTNEAIDSSEDEIDVVDAATLHIGEIIRIDFERMKILDIVSNTLLVMRGWGNTKKVAHNTGVAVYVFRTFTVNRDVNGTVAVTHTNAAINRYLAPQDVNYLCRQIAGLMVKKVQSGWAGKTGNAALGEVFYNNEFPADPLKRIMNNYRLVNI